MKQKHRPALRIEFDGLRVDPPGTPVTGVTLAFTNIEANVKLYLDGSLFVEAPFLCVVEFAGYINAWLRSLRSKEFEFRFESWDDDEPNILSLGTGDDGLKITSGWQKFVAQDVLDKTQTIAELERFVADVRGRYRSELGLEAGQWIGSRRL